MPISPYGNNSYQGRPSKPLGGGLLPMNQWDDWLRNKVGFQIGGNQPYGGTSAGRIPQQPAPQQRLSPSARALMPQSAVPLQPGRVPSAGARPQQGGGFMASVADGYDPNDLAYAKLRMQAKLMQEQDARMATPAGDMNKGRMRPVSPEALAQRQMRTPMQQKVDEVMRLAKQRALGLASPSASPVSAPSSGEYLHPMDRPRSATVAPPTEPSLGLSPSINSRGVPVLSPEQASGMSWGDITRHYGDPTNVNTLSDPPEEQPQQPSLAGPYHRPMADELRRNNMRSQLQDGYMAGVDPERGDPLNIYGSQIGRINEAPAEPLPEVGAWSRNRELNRIANEGGSYSHFANRALAGAGPDAIAPGPEKAYTMDAPPRLESSRTPRSMAGRAAVGDGMAGGGMPSGTQVSIPPSPGMDDLAGGGPSPYSLPGSVPSPDYAGMTGPRAAEQLLTGRDYLTNMAQTKRLARQNRIAGIDPRMAQLMAQNQQNAGRGFMAGKGLMEQSQADEANAAAMGFNSDMYRNRVGESLGLGNLGLQDASRRDDYTSGNADRDLRRSEQEARIRMAEEEQRRRASMMGKLFGDDGAQPSSGSGFLDAAMNGFGAARAPMAPGASPMGPSGGGGISPAMREALMAELMAPGAGIGAAGLEAAGRGKTGADPMDEMFNAQLTSATQIGDVAGAENVRRQWSSYRSSKSGGMIPSGPSIPSAPRDAKGNPQIDADYIQQVLAALPADASREQKLQALTDAGVNKIQLEDTLDESGPTWWDRMWEYGDAPIDRWTGADKTRKRRISRAADLQRQLESLGINDTSNWFNSPSTQPAR